MLAFGDYPKIVSAQQPPVYAQNPVGLAILPGSFIRNQASPDISSVLQRGSRASGAPGFRGEYAA